MNKILSCLCLAPMLLPVQNVSAESLASKLEKGDVASIRNDIKVESRQKSAQEKRVDDLTRTEPKPIDGITVKVAEVNLSKKATVDFQYAPPIKEGKVLDNEEKATVNVNIKF